MKYILLHFAAAHCSLSHYVLRGGGLEKCCNLQNPMNTSRQLGQVEICSTLRDLICHILWPFYCHFMAFFGSKWPYWAIGSPSDPKWVEHWLNMVEHCTSHLGGWVWTPLAPKKWHFGAPEPPKNDLFWSKIAILGHRQFVPNFVWIFFNRFLHLPF